MSKQLYIIAGCNGAGKTTASFNILPTILECKEFINADEIARGISPFQPEKAAFRAGRIMLAQIEEMLSSGESFAFETTLATRSFTGVIQRARNLGYTITLLYFWLESTELAEERVRTRVAAGGHDIPKDVIHRRYYRGVRNLFEIYQDICDMVILHDNSKTPIKLVSIKENRTFTIYDQTTFDCIKKQNNDS